MATLVRRLALFMAVLTCAGAAAARSAAYSQPLAEQETGTALVINNEIGFEGTVTGTPISDGEFFGNLDVDWDAPGSCLPAQAYMILFDDFGEIDKAGSGTLCISGNGVDEATLQFDGTYTIVYTADRYAGAQDTGTMTMTMTCPGEVISECSLIGTETSTAARSSNGSGPIKKGDDPQHVLLCSPKLVPRADGTLGLALQVPYADYAAWLKDAATHPEIPAGSIPSKYGAGIGLTCDNLPGFVASGKFADATGVVSDGTTDPGAIYPYWAPT